MPRKSIATATATAAATDAIAERAYFKALNRGFAPGFELSDWLEAEREVAALLVPAPKPRAKRSGSSKTKT
jgi:hypothetical protein